jgi:hypothetical protein
MIKLSSLFSFFLNGRSRRRFDKLSHMPPKIHFLFLLNEDSLLVREYTLILQILIRSYQIALSKNMLVARFVASGKNSTI